MIPICGRRVFPGLVSAFISMLTIGAATQSLDAPNAQPNPYRTVEQYFQLPAGMEWSDGARPGTPYPGQVVGVDVDAAGNILVLRRADPPLLKFDASGKRLLQQIGHGLIVMAHGLHIDREGFIWITDSSGREGAGYQVHKLSPDGGVVMSLGTKGVSGDGPNQFVAPTGVTTSANGDIFVSDGHGNNDKAHRVVRHARDGRFVKAWGTKGDGPDQLNAPHDIVIDSTGRLLVADRANSRIQIFDQDGRRLAEWRQFGRPEVMAIAKDDTLYVTDSQSNATVNPPFKKGIRVGSASTGRVDYFIPDTSDPASDGGAVAIGVDAIGNIYTAEVYGVVGFPRMMKQYVKP